MNVQKRMWVIVGAGLAGLLAVLAHRVHGEYEDLAAIERQVIAAKAAERKLCERLQLREGLVKDRRAVGSAFEELVAFLPSDDEFMTRNRMLSLISEFAIQAGLGFRSAEFPVPEDEPGVRAPAPAAGLVRAAGSGGHSEFEPVGVTIRCIGTFFQLMSFLNQLETHESFLMVNHLRATPLSGATGEGMEGMSGSNILDLELRVMTYRSNR